MKKNYFHQLLVIGLAFATSWSTSALSTVRQVQAQATPTPPNQQVQDVSVNTTQGTIVKKENNNLFVETGDGTVKQFVVPDGVSIQKNTQGSSLDNLDTNDSVTVKHTADNQLLSVEATSGEVIDFSKIAIPIAALAGLLLIAFIVTRKKALKPHIKTA